MDPLMQFIDQMTAKTGIDQLPEEVQVQQKEALAIQLQTRIGLAALDALDEKASDKYAKMMAAKTQPTPEKSQEFFIANIPNFQELMQKTVTTFAEEYFQAFTKPQ